MRFASICDGEAIRLKGQFRIQRTLVAKIGLPRGPGIGYWGKLDIISRERRQNAGSARLLLEVDGIVARPPPPHPPPPPPPPPLRGGNHARCNR